MFINCIIAFKTLPLLHYLRDIDKFQVFLTDSIMLFLVFLVDCKTVCIDIMKFFVPEHWKIEQRLTRNSLMIKVNYLFNIYQQLHLIKVKISSESIQFLNHDL